MNSYELTVVLDGKTTTAKKKTAIEKLVSLVETFEGKTGEMRDLGEKDLAYPINKIETGIYLTFPLQLQGDSAKKLQDKLRLEEYVLRYLMIRSENVLVSEEPKKKKTATKKAKTKK